MSADVPIEKMVLIAQFGSDGKATSGMHGYTIEIVALGAHIPIDTRTLTFGACEARWAECPEQRMLFLYELLWRLQLEFGFCPQQLHEAAKVVPEYCELLGNGNVAALSN